MNGKTVYVCFFLPLEFVPVVEGNGNLVQMDETLFDNLFLNLFRVPSFQDGGGRLRREMGGSLPFNRKVVKSITKWPWRGEGSMEMNKAESGITRNVERR